jgi:hypothetical protein
MYNPPSGGQRWENSSCIKKSELLHRVLCRGLSKEQVADHKDHDTLNNCHDNLLPATESQNRRNGRLKGGTSEYRGVSWHTKKGQWRVVAYKRHVGYFDDEIAAAKAHDDAVRHDEFANLNFPEARKAA